MHVAHGGRCRLHRPAPATESYLDMSEVLAAARQRPQAIHPGYGFLSENAGLCRGCAAAGIVFVGPAPTPSRDGLEGRVEAPDGRGRRAGSCLVITATSRTPDFLPSKPSRWAIPLLIKASAGGGGKGMRGA